MDDPFIRWLTGLSVAVIGGWLFTWAFYWGLGKYMKLPQKDDPDPNTRGVPSWITGMTERLFFAIIVGAEVAGAAVAMMVWLTVKMVTNWNRPGPSSASGENLAKQTTRQIRYALRSLLAGLVSMGCATVGGLICAGKLF